LRRWLIGVTARVAGVERHRIALADSAITARDGGDERLVEQLDANLSCAADGRCILHAALHLKRVHVPLAHRRSCHAQAWRDLLVGIERRLGHFCELLQPATGRLRR